MWCGLRFSGILPSKDEDEDGDDETNLVDGRRVLLCGVRRDGTAGRCSGDAAVSNGSQMRAESMQPYGAGRVHPASRHPSIRCGGAGGGGQRHYCRLQAVSRSPREDLSHADCKRGAVRPLCAPCRLQGVAANRRAGDPDKTIAPRIRRNVHRRRALRRDAAAGCGGARLGRSPGEFSTSIRRGAGKNAGARSPRTDALSRGFSWFSIRLPLSISDRSLETGIAAAADRVASFIRFLGQAYPREGRPLLTGFSQGGAISFAVAVRHPALVAASVPLAGALPAGLISDTEVGGPYPPIRAVHGDRDELIPATAARETADRLRASGIDVTLTVLDGLGHTVDRRARQFLFSEIRAFVAAHPSFTSSGAAATLP